MGVSFLKERLNAVLNVKPTSNTIPSTWTTNFYADSLEKIAYLDIFLLNSLSQTSSRLIFSKLLE